MDCVTPRKQKWTCFIAFLSFSGSAGSIRCIKLIVSPNIYWEIYHFCISLTNYLEMTRTPWRNLIDVANSFQVHSTKRIPMHAWRWITMPLECDWIFDPQLLSLTVLSSERHPCPRPRTLSGLAWLASTLRAPASTLCGEVTIDWPRINGQTV